MGCLSLGFLEQLLVWLVIASAVIAVLKLLIPWITSMTFPIVGQVLQIILWAVVAIIAIYIVFALLSCLIGGVGGLHFPTSR
jgi:hypothetical protein